MPLNLNLNLGPYSPYGPRARRPPKLTILWVACFFFIVFTMWFLQSRRSLDRGRPLDAVVKGGAVRDGLVSEARRRMVKSVRFGAGGS
ncbi:hypothetical protein QBC39DRAFT_378260 [Podospora conica]|nr:hypothetical protein QBC39DRAFT_378260 [Schizothecium conicum]